MNDFQFAILFAMAFLGQCFTPPDENEGTVCNPYQKHLTYQGPEETCTDCTCSQNGKALICTDISCTSENGKNVGIVNKWGLNDYKVVKMCSPGLAVYDYCNICICSKNLRPHICTLMACNLRSYQLLKREHPNYPLVQKY